MILKLKNLYSSNEDEAKKLIALIDEINRGGLYLIITAKNLKPSTIAKMKMICENRLGGATKENISDLKYLLITKKIKIT